VAREFKRDPVLRDIPLVAMTASVATGKADQVGIIAFDHFLQKPIHPETFAAQVEYFLAAGVVNRFDPPSVAPASGESPLPKLVT
jgi:CheY-like chemotaxis protein